MAEQRYPVKGGEPGRGSRYRRENGQWPEWMYHRTNVNEIVIECQHCHQTLKVLLREWVTGVHDTQRHRLCPYCAGYSQIPSELQRYKGT